MERWLRKEVAPLFEEPSLVDGETRRSSNREASRPVQAAIQRELEDEGPVTQRRPFPASLSAFVLKAEFPSQSVFSSSIT